MELFKKKLEFNNNRSTRIGTNDVCLIHSLNSCGIYIYISPSNKTAYVGKSDNIYRRLREHIRNVFIDFENSTCTSKIILREDDVEMYCCFLKSRNQYDYSCVNDLDKELRILESFIMDVVKYNGYNLVNKGQGDYDISNLESSSIYEYKDTINIGDNIFKFGLDNILKLQLYNNTSAIDFKINKLNEKIDKYESEIKKLNNQINNLKNDYNFKVSQLNNTLNLKTAELDDYKYLFDEVYNLYKNFIIEVVCKYMPYHDYNSSIEDIINSTDISSENLDLKSKIANKLDENMDIKSILNNSILLEILKLSATKTRASTLFNSAKTSYEKCNLIGQYLKFEYNCLTEIYNIILK